MSQNKSNPNRCNKCGVNKKPSDFKIKNNGDRAKCCNDCLNGMKDVRRGNPDTPLKEIKKSCSRCKKLKPLSSFGKSKVDGRSLRICKDCLWYHDLKVKARRQKARDETPPPLPAEIDVNSPVDLAALMDIGGFNKEEVIELIKTVTVYTKKPHYYSAVKVYEQFFPHRSPKECKQIIEEFKEAHIKGMDFDKAFETRQFRKDGLKQLAGKK